MSASRLRIAADVGGTFTDVVVFLGDGEFATCKVPSTPDDYGRGVIEGLLALAGELGLPPERFGEVLHGCTVATNAILELKGARTALLTTRGFRDVLELRRIRVPRLYDPLYVKPAPLAPRNLRFEVTERIAHDGTVISALDEADVEVAAKAIREAAVEAVAVCFLHSYANPDHERRAGAILRALLPDLFVTLSVDVLPEIREYERTSTTVVNAYVGPPVSRYVRALGSGLKAAGFSGPLLVMQSSGGILDAEAVGEVPARIVECGPAAGVIGAAHAAARCGYRDLITFDMGGTTAKASLIEGGRITRTDEYEVGSGISLSSRLVKGGGYALKFPVIDISEVGAGGGSIVRVDKAGALKVGPDSAGAVPGPACYGAGGTFPTVTDANVVLGYLNPRSLAGGTVPIHAELSLQAIERAVARPLGVSAEEAAWSVHVVAAATMVRAVKAVSTYRGRDPSNFVLMAFGGNGGVFAAELMHQLSVTLGLVPPAAGVFSAIGLGVGNVEFNRSRAFPHRLSSLEPELLGAALACLEATVTARIDVAPAGLAVRRSAAMRYVGQAFELVVAVPDGPVGEGTLRELRGCFETEHERTYGHRLAGFDVEIVAIDVAAAAPSSGLAPSFERGRAAGPSATRPAYFGPQGWLDTPVIARQELGHTPRRGPLVVEDYDGTTVVPPDATARLDDHRNIELRPAVV